MCDQSGYNVHKFLSLPHLDKNYYIPQRITQFRQQCLYIRFQVYGKNEYDLQNEQNNDQNILNNEPQLINNSPFFKIGYKHNYVQIIWDFKNDQILIHQNINGGQNIQFVGNVNYYNCKDNYHLTRKIDNITFIDTQSLRQVGKQAVPCGYDFYKNSNYDAFLFYCYKFKPNKDVSNILLLQIATIRLHQLKYPTRTIYSFMILQHQPKTDEDLLYQTLNLLVPVSNQY